jgi:hypothetical protein
MTPLALPITLAALAALPARSPSPPRPAFDAAITGRLRFLQDGKAVSIGEAQRLLAGRRIGLALRSGWKVAPAKLEADGRFAAEIEPGTWRLEWIDVGDDAEFLPRPLEVEARDGRTTCAGQITVTFDDVQSELGANAAGTVTVEDRCGELGAPGKRSAVSLARPAGDPAGEQIVVDWMDVASGLRTEAGFDRGAIGLRVGWSIPFRKPLAWKGNYLVSGAVVRYWDADRVGNALEAGAGFSPFNGLELSAGVQVGMGGGGSMVPWANFRVGGLNFAWNLRALVVRSRGVLFGFGFDLTPFHVLGSFL